MGVADAAVAAVDWGCGAGADTGVGGRRDGLERERTRRLCLSRTPLGAVRCSWQHPGMAKEGTPTQIHAHAGTHTPTRSASYRHHVEALITGLPFL